LLNICPSLHLLYCCLLLLSLQAVFSQGSASTVGVLLRSWHQGGEGGAAVLYNWESGLLEVVFEALDPATMSFSLTAPMARRIGGPLQQKPGQPLALRLLLDARWVVCCCSLGSWYVHQLVAAACKCLLIWGRGSAEWATRGCL
jgi:hypothetical protein